MLPYSRPRRTHPYFSIIPCSARVALMGDNTSQRWFRVHLVQPLLHKRQQQLQTLVATPRAPTRGASSRVRKAFVREASSAFARLPVYSLVPALPQQPQDHLMLRGTHWQILRWRERRLAAVIDIEHTSAPTAKLRLFPRDPANYPGGTHLTHLRALRLQQWRNGCARKRRANELAQHVSCNTLRARLEKRGRDERSASSKRGDYCMVHEGKSEPSVCRSSRFKGEACGCSRKIATNRCNAIEVEV